MKFVEATVDDLPRIVELVNSCYRGEYSKTGWTTEADLLDGQRTDVDSLREFLDQPANHLFITVENGKILASVAVTDEEQGLYFGMLSVEPGLQGKGIAKFIMNQIEELARSKNFSHVRLSVIDLRTELIAYYVRRGFKPTGNWEPFPENDPKFGLPKTKMRLLEYKKPL